MTEHSMSMPFSTHEQPRRTGGSQAQLRVGNLERGAVADLLSQHCAAGRLTIDELDDRLSRVWAARNRRDLDACLAELPPLQPAAKEVTLRSWLNDGRLLLRDTPWGSLMLPLVVGLVGLIALAGFVLLSMHGQVDHWRH